ncbi:MAG: hypothetical protein ACI4N3_02200 [Alphaproteobacteria bacterium]
MKINYKEENEKLQSQIEKLQKKIDRLEKETGNDGMVVVEGDYGYPTWVFESAIDSYGRDY